MNNKKKKNMLPALAMAGPVSVWMILFVTIPMLYIIYISFMSRGVFCDVVYKFSTESYKTILNPTYFKVILMSLKAAGITTILCLLLGYPLAYIIAHKPKDTAAKLITLIMIPFWTNSLMRLNSWLLLFQTSGPINNFLVGTGVVKEPITFIYTDGLVLIRRPGCQCSHYIYACDAANHISGYFFSDHPCIYPEPGYLHRY